MVDTASTSTVPAIATELPPNTCKSPFIISLWFVKVVDRVSLLKHTGNKSITMQGRCSTGFKINTRRNFILMCSAF